MAKRWGQEDGCGTTGRRGRGINRIERKEHKAEAGGGRWQKDGGKKMAAGRGERGINRIERKEHKAEAEGGRWQKDGGKKMAAGRRDEGTGELTA
jgi:hypothetical protein